MELPALVLYIPVFRRSTMKVPTFSNPSLRFKSIIYLKKLDFIRKNFHLMALERGDDFSKLIAFDLVKNKKQQIKNFDVQSYNTEQNAAKVIL